MAIKSSFPFKSAVKRTHNKDYSPGDSFSDSSEVLSSRGRVGVMMYMKYFGRKMYVVKHPSW